MPLAPNRRVITTVQIKNHCFHSNPQKCFFIVLRPNFWNANAQIHPDPKTPLRAHTYISHKITGHAACLRTSPPVKFKTSFALGTHVNRPAGPSRTIERLVPRRPFSFAPVLALPTRRAPFGLAGWNAEIFAHLDAIRDGVGAGEGSGRCASGGYSTGHDESQRRRRSRVAMERMWGPVVPATEECVVL